MQGFEAKKDSYVHFLPGSCILYHVCTRGGVEDTRLEAKAKDTKKIRGQGQGQPFWGQTLSRPRTGMLEAKAKDQVLSKKKKKGLHKNFSGDLQKKKKKKKKVFTKMFQAISTKKRFPKNFSSTPQNFNNSKYSAVLEPRTGQFSRTWGLEAKAKDFKMCPRGLHLWFAQPNRESNPGEEGWELSMLTTTLPSLQQYRDKMSYLNQMYEKKAMARAWAFPWLTSTKFRSRTRFCFKTLHYS